MLAFWLVLLMLSNFYIPSSCNESSSRRQLDIPAMRSYFEKLFPKNSKEFSTIGLTPPTSKPINKENVFVTSQLPLRQLTYTRLESLEPEKRLKESFRSEVHDKPLGSPTITSRNPELGRFKLTDSIEESRSLRLKGDLGTSSLLKTVSFGSPVINVFSGPPINQPTLINGLPLTTKHFTQKPHKKPSKGYGPPPKAAYGAPPQVPEIVKSELTTPIIQHFGFKPIGNTGFNPTGPSDPILSDPGLIGDILNSPAPFVSPAFPSKKHTHVANGIGIASIPLQKPPLHSLGGLLDSQLLDPVLPIENGDFSDPVGGGQPTEPLDEPGVHLLNGPGNLPLSVQNSYDSGVSDDVGFISSFSYFRYPEYGKDLEYRFVDAGKHIAKQFYIYMEDHTGFPGNVRLRELEETSLRKKQKKNVEATNSKTVELIKSKQRHSQTQQPVVNNLNSINGREQRSRVKTLPRSHSSTSDKSIFFKQLP